MEPSPRWPQRPTGLAYGGDYNPEQWPEEIWVEDARLMRAAGVNLVSVGIFSWALLEPTEGTFDLDWLGRLLDLLYDHGVSVALANGSASAPAWFTRKHPEALPVNENGVVLGGGSRAAFCPSSPAYRAAAARITEQVATRFGEHPAVVMWHVHNEYGCHVPACYCATSAAAFRDWLRARYGDMAGLNEAWGTAFWGQHYADWDDIEPPRAAPTALNPTQRLDYMRFSSDQLLECYVAERDIIRRHSPGVPVTTNFMAGACKHVDYWRWASEVDIVANDNYLAAEEPENHIGLSRSADLTRSLAGGATWLLMEHSTGAVNWQPRNVAKRPGEMRRNSLTHVARGSDGALFFQWRASRRGAEKFHSAMVPHAGTETQLWRDVVALGGDLAALAELRDTKVVADAAVVWDYQSWWAMELDYRPSQDVTYADRLDSFYRRLWHDHLTIDFVHPEGSLAAYPLVLVPSLYLTTPAAAANLASYVESGGTVLVSYFSGIVDADDAVYLGGYPGAFRDLLGLSVEEFRPLPSGATVRLTSGASADVWTEPVAPRGAEIVDTYVDGPSAGYAAVTRHRYGSGTAWYVSTRLSEQDLAALLRKVYQDAGVVPPAGVPDGVEIVRRRGGDATYRIVINHNDAAATVPAAGKDLLSGATCGPELTIDGGDVRVIREH